MPRCANPQFTSDQLIEALEKTRGFILAAQKYLLKTFGIKTGYSTIKWCIREWGMQDWLDDIRKALVEDCLAKTFHKGVSDGDNHCLAWVLEKYAHHIDFLDGRDMDAESKKGWRELLAHVKGSTESDTTEKPS